MRDRQEDRPKILQDERMSGGKAFHNARENYRLQSSSVSISANETTCRGV